MINRSKCRKTRFYTRWRAKERGFSIIARDGGGLGRRREGREEWDICIMCWRDNNRVISHARRAMHVPSPLNAITSRRVFLQPRPNPSTPPGAPSPSYAMSGISSSQELHDPSTSSPDSPPRSQFTYRHLSQLSKSSVDCPLRVIAHIDLDAFYAQCEMKRLGLPKDEPLAVQQWVWENPQLRVLSTSLLELRQT